MNSNPEKETAAILLKYTISKHNLYFIFYFQVLIVTLTFALAWDPSLKIAEKGAIHHHIRHGYDYPYINIAQMMNRRGIAVRPAVGQQPSAFGIAPQQNLGFRQPAQALPPPPSRGFQGQPFDQNRGFSNNPRQTRFFNLGVPRSSPFGFERRSS